MEHNKRITSRASIVEGGGGSVAKFYTPPPPYPENTLLGVGACAMTTKFLDNKIFSFKILLS